MGRTLTGQPLDGRRFAPELPAVVQREGALIGLAAPRPGLARGLPPEGTVLVSGQLLCELEVLGQLHRVRVPEGVSGAVVGTGGARGAKVPVAHGTRLATLDPTASGLGAMADVGRGGAVSEAAAGLVFRAPLGGRYYARPSPDAPPFVEAGATIDAGHTVALLEVMKTFNRVRFGGAGLPERVRVVRVVPRDGDDVSEGDALLELAPA